jgi:glycogen operon protein
VLDWTGTGNSVRVSHPAVLRLVMDSLRYWGEEMHVDGFRFDLAPALARDEQGFSERSAFFTAINQDPVLSRVKLIAEPWDIGEGGYRTGGFPRGWSEWNDRFRDAARSYWLIAPHRFGDLGFRLAGSPDLFSPSGRAPTASVNFVTAHDGFTLADLVSYNEKHNLANGEQNRDGSNHNLSNNFGVEGPTTDPAIIAIRDRERRNLLATLMLSLGVPMLLGGDEFGRTQRGNNNAYCQDNRVSWFDWDLARTEAAFVQFTARLIKLRKELAPLWRTRPSTDPQQISAESTVAWFRPDGAEMRWEDWIDPAAPSLGYRILRRTDAGAAPMEREPSGCFVAFNAGEAPVIFALPPSERATWSLECSTDPAGAAGAAVPPRSVSIFMLRSVGAESQTSSVDALIGNGDL